MNNTLKTILIVAAVLVIALGLFLGGMFFNRMIGWNNYMMGGYASNSQPYYGPGGMMGYGERRSGPGGMMGNGYGPGGMMDDYGYSGSADVQPLSMEESEQAVQEYLASLGNDDLAIKEIMVFEQNSYAIIVEKSTGMGAFELLVDPATLAVFPEYGPNMMWNLKYGMHSGYSGHGMMGNRGQSPDVSADMSLSADEAAQAAQEYLDRYSPGVMVSDEITPFYGYYTIDLEQDGKIVGMLSVNGYNGQVFPHTWHGTFIEMSEEE